MRKTSPSTKYIPAPAFGKKGMSGNRFDEIPVYIRFSDQPKTQGEISSVWDCWKLVKDFVSAVNTNWRTMVTLSEHICVDECIARWYGQGGHWIDMGFPHHVAIDRKPENGCEIQNAACGRRGIMLNNCLVTTAEVLAWWTAEIEGTELGHGTAILSRLVQPWTGSGIILCADLYFASVEAEVTGGMGLKFIGIVKTATKGTIWPFYLGVSYHVAGNGFRRVAKSTKFSGEIKIMAMTWVVPYRR
jgi:Transposase IS4